MTEHLSPPHSSAYHSLLRAGPRPRPLTQVHAHLIVSGLARSLSILTKLLTSLISSSSIPYALSLLPSVPSPDSFLFDSLIRASSASPKLPSLSLLLYRRMLSLRLPPSNFTYTALLKSFCFLPCPSSSSLACTSLHSHLLLFGFDFDPFVQTALLVLYAKSGHLPTARQLFDRIPHPTLVAWNAMISAYDQHALPDSALALFRSMQITPDSATLVPVLSACSQTGDLRLGQWAHGYAITNGLDSAVVLGTSLVNLYARCGRPSVARQVFDGIHDRNVVAWTAMIAGYGMNGYGRAAYELFHSMRACGSRPNDVTFVAVLSACAHAGMVREGCETFELMERDYGLSPRLEHHVCMVDMFGRAGMLHEAMRFIDERIPGKPGPAVWTAMVSACKMHKNFDLGVEVAERLLAAEPDNASHYVLLSNIYALAGRMDQVEQVRDVMIHMRLKKETGYSSVEISGEAHVFRMGETWHPKTAEIYEYLEELVRRIKEAGYVPETDSVLHELEEEEREVALRFHSEKLAVAFGLMSTEDGALIRVVKNLKMCGDCHSAIKYISMVALREIVVRDKHRFHHFKEGSCSCRDYW